MGSPLKAAGICFVAATIALSAVVSRVSYAATRIGVASGVQNNVTGAISGRTVRLNVGDGVFQDQVVNTGAKSTAQLLFQDETALTVGPNSNIVLDKFVYNPSTKTGQIVMNATRGAFRFVSGSAKSSSYKINTPVASIGVRGTIFDWFINAAGDLLLILVEGGVIANLKDGQSVELTKPGQFVIIKADGSVQGPSTWTGRLLDVALGVPFPLFGKRFENDQTETPTFIDPSELNDAIDNTELETPDTHSSPPPIGITIP